MQWSPMHPEDVAAAVDLANAVHLSYPEDALVLRDRLRVYPEGCFVLADKAEVRG